MHIKPCDDPTEWDRLVHEYEGHPLQLWGWGELKTAHGWVAHRYIAYEDEHIIGAAQVLVKPMPWPLRGFAYIPRGPVCQEADQDRVLEAVAVHVKQHIRAVVLSVEPPREKSPAGKGWRRSAHTILIPDTLILDLSRTEDELQTAMTKKTRQYIRKSSREAISLRRVTQRAMLTDLLTMYHETATRAGFALHDDRYYYDVFDQLGEASAIYAASDEQGPVAFLWLAVSAGTAFELYGGMNERGQLLRANYALKWHAIRECKRWGVTEYDLNGLLNDGISTFKRGFANHETTLAGTYDYPLSRWYPVWSHLLPMGKRIVRTLKSLRK